MEDNKKILSCSSCGNQMRFPTDKHIKFSCAKCQRHFEYNNGVEVLPIKNQTKIKNQKRSILYVLISILMVMILVFVLFEEYNPERNKLPVETSGTVPSYNSTDVNTEWKKETNANSSVNDYRTSKEIEDSVIEQIVEDKIKDFIQDQIEDKLKEILRDIKNEASSGKWEKANKWYDETMDGMQKNGTKGQNLINRNIQELTAVKAFIVQSDPNHGSLPQTEIIDNNVTERGTATESIKNKTPYTLTVFYNGPRSSVITIEANREKIITLIPGTYYIVAEVNNISVKKFYGSRTYLGKNYRNGYYISTHLY